MYKFSFLTDTGTSHPNTWTNTTCLRHFGSSGENSFADKCGRVGWGKISMRGQSRSLEICICMLTINRPKVIRSTFLFSHWNTESRTGDPVTISSIGFQFRNKNIIWLTLPHHAHFSILYKMICQINQLLKSIAYINRQNFQSYVGFFILKLWDDWIMKLN